MLLTRPIREVMTAPPRTHIVRIALDGADFLISRGKRWSSVSTAADVVVPTHSPRRRPEPEPLTAWSYWSAAER